MAGYNPNTYDWYQCDEEEYNSNDSPEEQAESARAAKECAQKTIAAMRAAVAQVPSYCERYAQNCLKCDQPMPDGPYRGCLCKTCCETPSEPAITEVVIIRGK